MSEPMHVGYARRVYAVSLWEPGWRGRLLRYALLVLCAAGVSVAAFDGPVAELMRGKPAWLHQLAEWLSDWATFGRVWPVLVLGVLISFFGGLWQPMRWFLFAALCAATSGAVVNIIKFVLGRHRPNTQPLHPHQFSPFSTDYEFNSFPSGHSSDAAVWATVLWIAWPAARPYMVALACTFAATRVVLGVHWLSDILVGMLCGAAVTFVLHAAFTRQERRVALESLR